MTAHQFSIFLISELGALARDAAPIVREFASKNPKHQWEGKEQDPLGAHAWLERFEAMAKEGQP